MSNDTETTVVSSEVQEVPRGDNGTVGVATASKTMKRLWHEATHVLSNIGNKQNPRKQHWVRKVASLSLKQFARKLAATKDQTAIDFFACKKGDLNATRSDTNRLRITLEKQATRASRKSSSSGKSSKTVE